MIEKCRNQPDYTLYGMKFYDLYFSPLCVARYDQLTEDEDYALIDRVSLRILDYFVGEEVHSQMREVIKVPGRSQLTEYTSKPLTLKDFDNERGKLVCVMIMSKQGLKDGRKYEDITVQAQQIQGLYEVYHCYQRTDNEEPS